MDRPSDVAPPEPAATAASGSAPAGGDWEKLPKAEFGFPGPLRDRLVAAILDGTKTTTTGTVAEYEYEHEPLPRSGERSVVVDSLDRPVAVIRTTHVRTVRLGRVDLAHARDEGEGYTSVAAWHLGHREFWHSPEFRAAVGDPEFTVDADTRVVLQRFILLQRL